MEKETKTQLLNELEQVRMELLPEMLNSKLFLSDEKRQLVRELFAKIEVLVIHSAPGLITPYLKMDKFKAVSAIVRDCMEPEAPRRIIYPGQDMIIETDTEDRLEELRILFNRKFRENAIDGNVEVRLSTRHYVLI
jgi:hypothetical protein